VSLQLSARHDAARFALELYIYSVSYLYCGLVGFNTMCNPQITIKKNLILCYSLQSEELCVIRFYDTEKSEQEEKPT